MTFTLITRSLIIYIIVLFLIRLMGKRQVGQMQPFELVITLIIADLATVPMAETTYPLVHGIFPIITLCCVHFLLSFLSRKNTTIRKIINGKPVILIDPEGINYDNLKKSNMNFSDLQESLRNQGYFNLDEILYAIIQTNGTISILPRGEFAPLTANDMNIDKEENSLPIIIVAEGKKMEDNLKLVSIDDNKLLKLINDAGFKNIKDILIITIDSSGKLYIQGKKGNYLITQLENYGGDW